MDSIGNAMYYILTFRFCKHDPHIYYPYPILLGRQPRKKNVLFMESKQEKKDLNAN